MCGCNFWASASSKEDICSLYPDPVARLEYKLYLWAGSEIEDLADLEPKAVVDSYPDIENPSELEYP